MSDFFDNPLTSAYKVAGEKEIPLRLLCYQDGIYMTLKEVLNEEYEIEMTYDRYLSIVKKFDFTSSLPSSDDIIGCLMELGLEKNVSSDELLTKINSVHGSLKLLKSFTDVRELFHFYEAWKKSLTQRMIQEDLIRTLVAELQREMNELYEKEKNQERQIILFSDVEIRTQTSSFQIIHSNGEEIAKEDGIDIFNYARATQYVPYIQYNGHKDIYYKLYRGRSVDDQPNYASVALKEFKTQTSNVIYLTLWTGNPKSLDKHNISRATQESLVPVTIDLSTGLLGIETSADEDNTELGLSRVKEAFPDVDLIPSTLIESKKVRANFKIWNFELNQQVFLHLLLLHRKFFEYLFINENVEPCALKKQIDLHFRSLLFYQKENNALREYIVNPSEVTANISSRALNSDTVVTYYRGKTKQYEEKKLKSGTPYLYISLIADNEDRLKDFYLIFRLLLLSYHEEKDKVLKMYSEFLPELTDRQTRRVETSGKAKNRKGNIDQLQKAFPQIFTPGYARHDCQSIQQPVIMEDQELIEFKRHLRDDLHLSEQDIERRMIIYPKRGRRATFVCPNDRYPIMNVKVNSRDNRDTHPYVICCLKTFHNKVYQDYLNDVLPEYSVAAKANRKIITDKILPPERTAYLSYSLENFLINIEKGRNFVRMGVPLSVNSALHCLCFAVSDPRYLEATSKGKEEFVRSLRHVMSTYSYLLYKQELYDRNEEEIKNLIDDEDRFLDPSLVIRGMEELYDVNIFLFSKKEGEDIKIESPRAQLFSIRDIRRRPLVIILKHYGTESNNLLHPQCELIIETVEKNGIKPIFKYTFNNILLEIIYQKVITWIDGIGYINFNKQINPFTFFRTGNDRYLNFRAQKLDDYGKLRVLEVELLDGQIMTCLFPPSQPLNLPEISKIYRIDRSTLESFVDLKQADAVEITDGMITGYWFPIAQYPSCLFFFTTSHTSNSTLPVKMNTLPADQTNGKSIVAEYQKLQRNCNILLQLVYWLYRLYVKEVKRSVVGFFELIAEKEDDDYDFSILPRRLPEGASLEEAMRHLAIFAPSFVTNGTGHPMRLRMTEEFSEGLRKVLELYSRNYNPEQKTSMFLNDYYKYHSDFTVHPYNVLLIGEREFKNWFSCLTSEFKKTQIRMKLEEDWKNETSPYLYQTKTGKLYLIQNCLDGNRLRALTISSNWLKSEINTGYDTEVDESTDDQSYLIFGISSSGDSFVLSDNRKQGAMTSLSILYYGSYIRNQNSKGYAAMIEII